MRHSAPEMALELDRTPGGAATASGEGWRLLFWIVFGRSSNPMVLLSPDRRVLAANRAAVALTGYARDELIGRALDTILAPEDYRAVDAAWREVSQRGVFEGDRIVTTRDGRRLDVQYAMRLVHLDGSDVVLSVVIDATLDPVRMSTATSWQAGMLSPREIDVVTEVAMGKRAHEIADDLGIAESTVRTHIRNAMRKVNARSQAHLVALVLCGDVRSTAPLVGAAT